MDTIKREARIVMPVLEEPNSGKSFLVHRSLRTKLCGVFGGCTVTSAAGSWVGPDGDAVEEDVLVYDVAILPSQNAELARIAVEVGRQLKQHSVYVRYSHGAVDIIDVAKFDEEQARGGAITAEAPKPKLKPKGKHPGDAEVGDLWRTRDGSIVALVSAASMSVKASLLRRGATAMAVGTYFHYTYRAGVPFGRYSHANADHVLDLVEHLGCWDGSAN